MSLIDLGTMIVNDRIDYDEPNRHTRIELRAVCVDSGVPRRSATASVLVDVININDNTPVFTQVSKGHCFTKY